jgi:hypothetical protein
VKRAEQMGAALHVTLDAEAFQAGLAEIQEILNWQLHPETHLLLANAIFFKGNWARQFDEAKTQSMPFHRLDNKTIEVPMMFQLGRFPFGWSESAQVLQLPYEGGGNGPRPLDGGAGHPGGRCADGQGRRQLHGHRQHPVHGTGDGSERRVADRE